MRRASSCVSLGRDLRRRHSGGRRPPCYRIRKRVGALRFHERDIPHSLVQQKCEVSLEPFFAPPMPSRTPVLPDVEVGVKSTVVRQLRFQIGEVGYGAHPVLVRVLEMLLPDVDPVWFRH